MKELKLVMLYYGFVQIGYNSSEAVGYFVDREKAKAAVKTHLDRYLATRASPIPGMEKYSGWGEVKDYPAAYDGENFYDVCSGMSNNGTKLKPKDLESEKPVAESPYVF
jgi:hypothetical protein